MLVFENVAIEKHKKIFIFSWEKNFQYFKVFSAHK